MPSEGTYNGSFTVTEIDSGIDWDSDSKVNDIKLCRTFHTAPISISVQDRNLSPEFVPESVSGNVSEPLKESLNAT